MSVTIRRLVATILFGIVAIVGVKVLFTPGLDGVLYLTAALAFATAVYGWFTSEVVTEMQVARVAASRPVLVPVVEEVPPWNGMVRYGVRNVGSGPAIAIDVILGYRETLRFRLRTPAIAPGETRFVRTSEGRGQDLILPGDKAPADAQLVLQGSCRDLAGRLHSVRESVPFVDAWGHNLLEAIAKMTARDALGAAEREGREGKT